MLLFYGKKEGERKAYGDLVPSIRIVRLFFIKLMKIAVFGLLYYLLNLALLDMCIASILPVRRSFYEGWKTSKIFSFFYFFFVDKHWPLGDLLSLIHI